MPKRKDHALQTEGDASPEADPTTEATTPDAEAPKREPLPMITTATTQPPEPKPPKREPLPMIISGRDVK